MKQKRVVSKSAPAANRLLPDSVCERESEGLPRPRMDRTWVPRRRPARHGPLKPCPGGAGRRMGQREVERGPGSMQPGFTANEKHEWHLFKCFHTIHLTKSIQMAAEHGGPIPRGGVWPDSWRAALGSHDGRTRHPRWVPPPRPPGSLRCWCRGHWIPRSTSATPGDAPPLPSPAPPSDHHGLRLCSLSLRLLFCPSHLVPPCLFSPEL